MVNLTAFLRWYAQCRISHLNSSLPSATQEGQLFALLKKAQTTRFARDHRFSLIHSVKDFQEQVPLRRYEQFWEEYWKDSFPIVENSTWPGRIPYFPVSSGTTSGTTKFIPCTYEMISSNTKAGMDLLAFHLLNRPTSQLLGGKSFMLGGSTILKQEAKGVFSGDLSGISAKVMPWWAKLRYFPPAELALLSNWEEKIEILARASLQEDIRMLSGVPSWLLIFLSKLQDLNNGAPLCEIYPNLEMLVHGGVNFAPYYDRFRGILSGSNAELREVYPASEGFIAIADRGYGEGLRLNTDHGIFFEFVPVEDLENTRPTRHWIKNIELDVNYAIALTTCAGLWSYLIGDTVKFIQKDPPRLLITGRTSYMLSAFGEHLIGEEIEGAVSEAAKRLGLVLEDYSVGAVFPKSQVELGGHLYVIEFQSKPAKDQTQKFRELLDSLLCKRNEDYEAHRAKGFGLKMPEILLAPQGTFTAWMRKRGKLGGQNKVPRIINDQQLFWDLVEFAERSPHQ
jgi:hypothetical protein